MLEVCCELSANHLGDRYRAFEIVSAAASAGANLFKVQVWQPDTMCVDQSYVLKSGPWEGRRLFDLYREAWTPWEWLPELFAYCRRMGMEPFGAAFDAASVDFLESLGVKRHKVASFELVDLPLIRYMASKGKPMILSTGMADWSEIARAIDACGVLDGPCQGITLLACTSAYPADARDANLTAAADYYGPAFGLSDHSQGIGVAVAAVALGATYIEKHLTLSRADGGPDGGFSMEPHEFKAMVDACRQAHAAVQLRSGPPKGEDRTLRRSLWVVKATPAGQPLVLTDNVRTARPASGLACDTRLTTAARNLTAGQPLQAGDMERSCPR